MNPSQSLKAEHPTLYARLNALHYTDLETWQIEQVCYEVADARRPLTVGEVMNLALETAQKHYSVDAIANTLWTRKTW